MRELFNITPHTAGDGFTMRLKTGTVDVPDECGGYIISTSMGAGKTESIKSLIRQEYDKGILYCVDTKEELGKMYRWIITELVDSPSCGLTEDDVMIVSTEYEYQPVLRKYRDSPEILTTKKVVLITHVRFWTDLISYFLIYRPDGNAEITPFDGDFRALMSRDDLRRYVVFDETPTFIRPFAEFDRTLLGVFGKTDSQGNIVSMDRDEIRRYYDLFVKGGPADLFNDKYRINRIKRDLVLSLIPEYYGSWMMENGQKVGITFSPADLFPEGTAVRTHILVFEGAGDILFRNPSFLTLLDVKEKYNAVTGFIRTGFGLRRDCMDSSGLDSFLDSVSVLIDKPTLVVCWKYVNGHDEGPGKSSFTARIREGLIERGVRSEMFSVTYYGASDNKSTNRYMDMRQIILCGDWSMPNTDAAKIRRAYGTETDPQDLKMWYFAQLITRIGIRKHISGERYTVFYTDDFDKAFIGRLDSYFNSNRLTSGKAATDDDWEKRLDGMRIRSNTRREIIALAGSDCKMRKAIAQGNNIRKEVTFDQLEQLGIIRTVHERRRYGALIRTLAGIGIELVIVP